MLSDVKGQDEAVHFLRRFVEGKYTSPLLLVGDAGVGRRFAVQQAVREAFCGGTREPNCSCLSCYQLEQGIHPDLVTVSAPEDKDILVDVVREAIGQADNAPTIAAHRWFVFDGADRMNAAAANALLKTLEEPPSRARFLLLAENFERVLPTIRSRCGRVSFRLLPESYVLSVVQRFESDATKALVYARMGEGSIGRAVQYWGAGRIGLRDRVYSLLQISLGGDLASIFAAIDDMAKELSLAMRFLDHLLFDVLMVTHDSKRLINLDLEEGLLRLRSGLNMKVWTRLANGVQTIRDRSRSTRINVAFHLKALFVELFVGV